MEQFKTDSADAAAELAAAAKERGTEQLDAAKDRLAEGAERVADAFEDTADALDERGDSGVSGIGRSVASLVRQLSGGLRERDVDAFASELADLGRRNPAVFLAGSVALGFGVARFFKARGGAATSGSWRPPTTTQNERQDFDSDDSLDLSAPAQEVRAATAGERDADPAVAGGVNEP